MAEDEIVSITDSVDMNLRALWEMVEERGAWLQSMDLQSRT